MATPVQGEYTNRFPSLPIEYREHRVLRISFWIKLHFVVVEVILAIAFAVCTFKGIDQRRRRAGVGHRLPLFLLYIFLPMCDLYPAVYTRASGGYKTTNPHDRYVHPDRWGGGGGEQAGEHLAAPRSRLACIAIVER